jgi:hypothetical protein
MNPHINKTNRDKMIFWEEQLSQALWDYVPPILCSLGTGLNVLTIVVLLVRRFGKASTRILLITLAFADTAVLLGVLLPQWFSMSVRMRVYDLTPASCAIHKFTTFFFFHFSSWNVMLVTVERWISVIYPFKAKVVCTAKTTYITLVTVSLLLFALNAHILFFEKLNERTNVCIKATDAYLEFWDFTWRWIDFVAYTCIPFLVILVCNVSILVVVIRSYNHRKQLQNPGRGGDSEKSARMTSMTYMLTTVSVTFIVLTLPVSVYYLSSSILVTDHDYAVDWLINDITNLISYLNNGINFLLYCFSGSQFRREVYRMFRCIKRGPAHSSLYS